MGPFQNGGAKINPGTAFANVTVKKVAFRKSLSLVLEGKKPIFDFANFKL